MTGIQNRIVQAQTSKLRELSVVELGIIAAKVCTECGIKEENFPAREILMLCLQSWNDKFKAGMSIEEIRLAFEMNVNGELEKKIEHFHCFSREYFCDVMNEYLAKKKDVLKYIKPEEEEKVQLPPADLERQIFEAIIQDFKAINKAEEPAPNFTLKVKLELILSIYNVNITEATVIKLRERAAVNILKRNAEERSKLDPEKNIGRFNTLLHQSARLKTGKLLNDKDEEQIRFECDWLVYTDLLTAEKPKEGEEFDDCEFVKHVRENMELV